MSQILTRDEGDKIINEYGNIFKTNDEETVIHSITEYPTLESLIAFPAKTMTGILTAPFTQWDKVNPKAKPVPDKIPAATIHVRLLQAKAWMDGKVSTKIKNTGDVDFEDTVQDKVNFKETKTKKKIKYVKDAKKKIGALSEGKSFNWKVSWKVDGIWNIFKALISLLTTGKIPTTFTCRVDADYKVNGTTFFVIPQTKTEKFSKSYDVKADVVIARFKTDVRW